MFILYANDCAMGLDKKVKSAGTRFSGFLGIDFQGFVLIFLSIKKNTFC